MLLGRRHVDVERGEFCEVALTKQIAESIAMGASYKANDFAFGRVRSGSFLVTFGF